MIYKKIAYNKGDYVDNSGNRFCIMEGNIAYAPDGINVGWEAFESKEKAIEAYRLEYSPLSTEEINTEIK